MAASHADGGRTLPASGRAERADLTGAEASTSPERLRVAFVVCPSYHGATLLALLLNNHSQISALGDTLPWRTADQLCGCGNRVSGCAFWQSLTHDLDTSRFSGVTTLLPLMPWPLLHRQVESGVLHLSDRPHLNRIAGGLAAKLTDVAAPIAWRLRPQTVADFVETYRSFYRLVLEMHGTTTFVDGSKSWRKVALLARQLQPAADVRIIHLARDPRGFASSWLRHGGARDIREPGWVWAGLHRRMELLQARAPYRLLRYEDLCTSPEAEMQSVFHFLGVEPENVVSAPKYPHKHHILGNLMFRTFSGSIALDERWRSELSPADQRTVLLSAGELAERLGYA